MPQGADVDRQCVYRCSLWLDLEILLLAQRGVGGERSGKGVRFNRCGSGFPGCVGLTNLRHGGRGAGERHVPSQWGVAAGVGRRSNRTPAFQPLKERGLACAQRVTCSPHDRWRLVGWTAGSWGSDELSGSPHRIQSSPDPGTVGTGMSGDPVEISEGHGTGRGCVHG